jgi:hypothetical protein
MDKEALEKSMKKQIMLRIQQATQGTNSRRKYWAKVIDLAYEREKRRIKNDQND